MTALKWITTEAKKIYKRGGTWAGAIKKAGAMYRAKHKGKTHKPAKKKAARKKSRKVGTMSGQGNGRSVSGTLSGNNTRAIAGLTVSQHMAKARTKLEEKIGAEMMRAYKAPTKRQKLKINKRISALKTQFRKLC